MPSTPDQIFTLDYVDVVRGREADYMASSHSLVAAHGQSILADTGVMQFQATEVAGEWPCVVNVWERSWQTWVNTVAGRFTDGGRNTAVEEWWQANTAVRTGGLDLVLTGSPATASLVDAAKSVAHCPVFLIDTVRIPAAVVEPFLDAADSILRARRSTSAVRWSVRTEPSGAPTSRSRSSACPRSERSTRCSPQRPGDAGRITVTPS